MADVKQAQLNGAYYGPQIPPRRDYRSVGRRSSDCGCCLLCTLFKFIFSIVITVGVAVFVFWLIFRPNEIKAYVEDATLTRFNLSPDNSTLQYNLALNMSIRNPNKRIGIYYDYIEARALYDDNRFDFQTLPPFYQGHKTTSMVHPAFEGQHVALGSVASTFTREKGEGNFYIDVDLKTNLRLKIWIFKIHHVNPKIDCTLKLPVPSKGSSTTAPFERTKCHVKMF